MESFLLQFRPTSQVVDKAEIIKLLIEALGTYVFYSTFGIRIKDDFLRSTYSGTHY